MQYFIQMGLKIMKFETKHMILEDEFSLMIKKELDELYAYANLIENLMNDYKEKILFQKHKGIETVEDFTYRLYLDFSDEYKDRSCYELELDNDLICKNLEEYERLEAIEFFNRLFDFPVNNYIRYKKTTVDLYSGKSYFPIYKCCSNNSLATLIDKYLAYALRFNININENCFLKLGTTKLQGISVSYKYIDILDYPIKTAPKNKEEWLKIMIDIKNKTEDYFLKNADEIKKESQFFDRIHNKETYLAMLENGY